MTKVPFIYSEDDGEPIALPYKWEICSQCEGEGRSSAYLGAFTWDELHEQGDEFIEDYFAGNFDKSCGCCGGSGKITVADYGKMTEDQVKAYEQQLQDDYEYEAMRNAERRMGC
jgi:RecJ-like exonuclease